ncbi:NtaA/DmoA family FMN-dependent monooxygenase [Microbacterium faecale]|nr:NtaA/DmoA family FMN-dependent monooxygenase [Microbacterium faecale]
MSGRSNRQMALTMFMVGFGFHNDAWRRAGSRAEEIGELSLIRDMACSAERARLDAIFFADSYGAKGLRDGSYRGTSVYEPISVMGVLSGHTDKIGMIGTQSTSWNEPYTVARQLASLDVLTGGRIGWNIVTSTRGNENVGREEMPLPELRYRRAMEFVDVVQKLWDTWDSDAVIADRASGRWVDEAKIREINHRGEFFGVEGPLSIRRSPQEWPVLVQAGQSADGIELGSTYADIIYAVQPDRAGAIEFYSMYKEKVRAKGRDPEKVKVLPGIMPVVGETEADAEELSNALADCIVEESGRAMLGRMLEFDLSDLELNEKIPSERFVDGPQHVKRWYLFRDMAQDMTLRELMVHASRSLGHRFVVGTPAQVAESMIDWFDARACDGYNFNPPSIPEGMENMFGLLIPELQNRGYFRDEYVGDTFRERSGLMIADTDVTNVRRRYV